MLVSGLFTLVLVFSPLVVRPTVMRIVAKTNPTRLENLALSPLLSLAFGFAAVASIVLATTGQRSAKTRNTLAYAALVIAVIGVATMLTGIYCAVR